MADYLPQFRRTVCTVLKLSVGLLLLALAWFTMDLYLVITSPPYIAYHALAGAGVGVSVLEALLATVIFFKAFKMKTESSNIKLFYRSRTTSLMVCAVLGMLVVFSCLIFITANYLTTSWLTHVDYSTTGAIRTLMLAFKIFLGSSLVTRCTHGLAILKDALKQAAGDGDEDVERLRKPIVKKSAGFVQQDETGPTTTPTPPTRDSPPPTPPTRIQSKSILKPVRLLLGGGGDISPTAPSREEVYEEVPEH